MVASRRYLVVVVSQRYPVVVVSRRYPAAVASGGVLVAVASRRILVAVVELVLVAEGRSIAHPVFPSSKSPRNCDFDSEGDSDFEDDSERERVVVVAELVQAHEKSPEKSPTEFANHRQGRIGVVLVRKYWRWL